MQPQGMCCAGYIYWKILTFINIKRQSVVYIFIVYRCVLFLLPSNWLWSKTVLYKLRAVCSYSLCAYIFVVRCPLSTHICVYMFASCDLQWFTMFSVHSSCINLGRKITEEGGRGGRVICTWSNMWESREFPMDAD